MNQESEESPEEIQEDPQASVTRAYRRAGLGLAIVKEICHRYQWQVDYTFSDNLHSFSVQF